MPLNIPGILVPFHLLITPRLIIPHLVVNDIRQIDFLALKRAGYRGAVFDKDNCLTLPHRDTLIPELQDSWRECRQVFGEGNVLVVSNSAGTRLDAGGIQAESVTHHLGVAVLRHASLKPSYACIKGIRAYFSTLHASESWTTKQSQSYYDKTSDPPSLPCTHMSPVSDSELIIVGDRIFTDVVLANRMRANPPSHAASPSPGEPNGPLAIWTTGVWERESMLMRWAEKRLVKAVESWTQSNGTGTERFVKKIAE